MEKSIMEALEKITVMEFLRALGVITVLFTVLISQKKKIVDHLNRWRKTRNDEDDFKQLVFSLKDSVKELSNKVGSFQESQKRDREDFNRVQKEIYEAISVQASKIEDLTDTTLLIEERNSKTKRAEIKEKIERIYRECSPSQTCTDMQYETLRELIDEYEERGGKNSFVHTVVEPEMVLWERTPVVRNL